jgi:hypothetical protein
VIGIPRPDGWFDYIYQRYLVGAIPKDKWKQHIQECVRVCGSDDWVEFVEMDGQVLNGGPASQKFSTWTIEGVKARGIDLNMVQDLEGLMRETGPNKITKQIFTMPIGPWGGKASELFSNGLKLASSSLQPLITAVLCVPKEEVEKLYFDDEGIQIISVILKNICLLGSKTIKQVSSLCAIQMRQRSSTFHLMVWSVLR